jgi:hypothetical protein
VKEEKKISRKSFSNYLGVRGVRERKLPFFFTADDRVPVLGVLIGPSIL